MRHLGVALAALLLSVSLSAATYELPTDTQLRDRADLIVVATVLDSAARQTTELIVTDHRLRVEEVLKGEAAGTITVSEAGGFVNGRGVVIAGSASYQKGTRVLAFLRSRGDGTWFTAYMALGQYRFDRDLLVRDARGIETIGGDPRDVRDAEDFLESLQSGVFQDRPLVNTHAVRDADPVANASPPSSYVFNDGSPVRPIRWENCETACFMVYDHKGIQTGGASMPAAVDAAMAVWTDHANSFVFLTRGGASGKTFSTVAPDGENTIFFNHTGTIPSFCDAGLGCGLVWAAAEHVFRGTTWYTAFEGDVVILPNSLTQTALNTLLAHEVGHTLAFVDTGNNALMNGTLNLNRGAVLGAWDEEALTQVYGPGVACTPVSNVSVSGGGSVPSGSSANLSVTASGDGPLQYQWYRGTTGVTTNPVGTNSPNFNTGPITTETSFWVKVANACPSSANSATVTVTPIVCDEPIITTQPASQTITAGSSASLSVAVNGTPPFSYQWYRGPTPGNTNTSVPVGNGNATYPTGALQTTTSYWVRVTNNCGTTDSALATITVNAQCVAPTITLQPTAPIGVPLGSGATIGVSATGNSPLSYQWYEGDSPDQSKPIGGATQNNYAAGPFNSAGTYKFWVRVSNSCGSKSSNTIVINVACGTAVVPEISVPAATHFSTPYTVAWTGELSVTPEFQLQEATNPTFSQNLKSMTVNGALSRIIQRHSEITEETRFYYRVRAISGCNGQPTDWSTTASTVVTPPLPANSKDFAISIPVGTTTSFTQDYLVPGFGETATNGDTFSVTTDAPWLTVFPASGALSAGGTTVQFTINPAPLEIGSSTATVSVQRTQPAASKVATTAGTSSSSFPFSVSLVTPVSPDPRDSGPPAGTLIIPAVAHAQGSGSEFRSDVRIVNVSFDAITYEISYTEAGVDGTQISKKTTITIDAGDTIAFDDIVKAWYGAGTLGEGGIGTIEIRPLNGANPLATFASSRTYALTAERGTLGQFIPALRLDQFVGDITQDPLNRISLQQVVNNQAYRTNLGFVEGSGSPVTFLVRLLNGSGQEVNRFTRSLQPFGQFQSSLISLFGNVPLEDGRVEVEATSPTGKVSAYASVLNNLTDDPLLVFPVQAGRTKASRYVIAGIAEFESPFSNFHSDMRIYNAGTATETVTLWYYDRGQTNPGAEPRQITLAPGEVRAINGVLPTLWPGLIGGGSIVATASPEASLVLTAQTFSRQANGGTKGQFIPGVTATDGVGPGERAIEVLQLEQSAQYRSNVGVVEITGAPVELEISMVEPDSKVTVSVPYTLQANEYRQFDRILESFGNLGTVYNGRVAIRVIGGTGRVYAYGSMVDNRTEDPTYVPGQ